MANSYFHCCGMCIHCNLYDRDWMSGKFYCTERRIYTRPDDDTHCRDFENDNRRTYDDIERAREGRLR